MRHGIWDVEYGIEMATGYLFYLKIMGYEPLCVCIQYTVCVCPSEYDDDNIIICIDSIYSPLPLFTGQTSNLNYKTRPRGPPLVSPLVKHTHTHTHTLHERKERGFES